MAVIEKDGYAQCIRSTHSTAPKWQSHDIGFVRKTNIAAWCGDYDFSIKLYNELFGEGQWEIEWYESNPFSQTVIYQYQK